MNCQTASVLSVQAVEKEKDLLVEERGKLHQDWEVQKKLEISNVQRQEKEDLVETLKGQVSEKEEEQRIHEKQLATERRRADRLQEKLSQLLTDPPQLTDITSTPDQADDVSSVSSWSMVSGEQRGDTSTRSSSNMVSPQGSPPGPGGCSDETVMIMVGRFADLQQDKCQLEEKISYLEASATAMADDLLKKTAVIQHYCMEPKTTEGTDNFGCIGEKRGVRRVFDMVRGAAAGGTNEEINRRLQTLLEETLFKNMQLSSQVHELSLIAAQNTIAEDSPSSSSKIG